MKILLVDQFGEIGGAQQSFLELLPALLDRQWSVQAALPGEGHYKSSLMAAGARVHHFPCGPYTSGSKSVADVLRFGFDFRNQCRVLSSLLASERFDLVYVNGPRLLPAVAYTVGRKLPVIFHAHNHIGRGHLLSLAGRCLRLCRAGAIACCDFIAEPLRRYVPPQQLAVVHNGTRDMRSTGRAVGSRDGFVVGVIGRIEPQKGQLDLLRALHLLASRGIEVRSVICGAETPRSQPYTVETRRLGAALNTRFVGWRHDIAPVLEELDVLVIPSRNEAFPRVMLEAFSAKVPVLAFDVGGVAEAIQDNRSGFLLSQPSVPALAARIASLTRQPDSLARVAINARQLWERNYDISIYRSRMMELLARGAFST